MRAPAIVENEDAKNTVRTENIPMNMNKYQYCLRKLFNRNSPSSTSMTGTGTIKWQIVGVKYHISFFPTLKIGFALIYPAIHFL